MGVPYYASGRMGPQTLSNYYFAPTLLYCSFWFSAQGFAFFLVGRCLIHKDPRLRAVGSKASDFGRLSLHPKNPNRGMLRTLVGQIFAL